MDNEGDLKSFEVPFHLEPQENTIRDGELKPGDFPLLVFPGVGGCIPIVLIDQDTGKIVGSIHANRKWTPERISTEVKKLKIETVRQLKIEYAERVSNNPDYFWDSEERRTILDWLVNKAGEELKMEIERTIVPTDSYIDHLGYLRNKGFVRLKVTSTP